MSNSLSEIEKRLAEFEVKFAEIENLNQFLAKQAKEYFLLFDSARKLNPNEGLKSFFKSLDKIMHKNFNIDEYSIILKNQNSDILSIKHSMGLPKRQLREIFYRTKEGLVGKVFTHKRAVYIPDARVLKNIQYYFQKKPIQGSLYFLPINTPTDECIGVLKMRKYATQGFSEVERAVLPNLQSEIGTAIMNARKMDLLKSKTYLDELTQLYNRQFFDAHFIIEFKRAQRYQHEFSIIHIELSNLKSIQSEYSRKLTQHIIRKMGMLLKKFTRSSDFCIRYTEKEFMILLPETSKQSAYEAASKLLKAIQKENFNPNGSREIINVLTSVGIANYPQDTIEPKLLVDLAAKAMSTAKRSGENQISFAETLP